MQEPSEFVGVECGQNLIIAERISVEGSTSPTPVSLTSLRLPLGSHAEPHLVAAADFWIRPADSGSSAATVANGQIISAPECGGALWWAKRTARRLRDSS